MDKDKTEVIKLNGKVLGSITKKAPILQEEENLKKIKVIHEIN